MESRCGYPDDPCEMMARLSSHQDCDSLGGTLDGRIEVRDLVHVYDTDGSQRGLHSGRFRWESGIGLIFGKLSGITNAGTHQAPAFDECQRCADPVMEGQLCGTVCRTREPRVAHCQVIGSYLLRVESSSDGLPEQRVVGTFEGVLVCPCQP
jgi:hypothetical protein